jgi:hypothetical protein
MRFSWIIALVFLTGCRHIGLLFERPGVLKAVVQGEIKGVAIHCEKTITLGKMNWEIMCKVSDDVDIKYRTQPINTKQIKLEVIIDKQTGDTNKVIAAPVMIVSKGKPASLEMTNDKGHLDIRTEPVK